MRPTADQPSPLRPASAPLRRAAGLPEAAPDASPIPHCHLLFVGPQAIAAQALLTSSPLLPQLTDHLTTAAAESILEAVLVSGQPHSTEGIPPQQLILVDIANEIEHLEAGIRSLQRVNPGARILLLCEPIDEISARKARAWGAHDYFILPLDSRGIETILSRPAERPLESAPFAASSNTPPPPGALPAIPLILQTELHEDLLAGRPDFAEHAISTLNQHLRLPGRLYFVAGPETPKDDHHHLVCRPVGIADQPPFGSLVLETAPVASTPELLAHLAQIAHWLAGLMAIAKRYEQLRSLATTDELSGAFNRRYFLSYMSRLLDRARENRSRVTLLLFDIDDFKKYNDTFGHAAGDAIIRELIKILRACTRQYDLVARIGGDEFAVVYRDNEAPRQPNSEHPRDVLAATERFREAIRTHRWPETCNIRGEVSISGGLATFPWDADTLETLMSRADQALLEAKTAGKNVILMHSHDRQSPPVDISSRP